MQNDFEYITKREVKEKHDLSGMTYETGFCELELAYIDIIVVDEQIIMRSKSSDDTSYIEIYWEGMKHGYKIAMHKNEAAEIMREMNND